MAKTLYQFTPGLDTNFTFQPTIGAQQYTVVVVWQLFGQRWMVNLYTLQQALVFSRPLRASPENYDINLLAGYFDTGSLVYRDGTNNFEVVSP